MRANALDKLVADWERWAAKADRSEAGWQSDYPRWGALIQAAAHVLRRGNLRPGELALIEKVFVWSEEAEQLADFAREIGPACLSLLEKLTTSRHAVVRWQVYDVAGDFGGVAESILRRGLSDSDPYCRRRAILAYARTRPYDAASVARGLLSDDDPYVRQAAIQLVLSCGDESLRAEAERTLGQDSVEHVRIAAAEAFRAR